MRVLPLNVQDESAWELPASMSVPFDPYMNSIYQRQVALIYPAEQYLIYDQAAGWACYLQKECCSKRPWLFHKLRTLDWSVIRLPGILAHTPEHAIKSLMDSSAELSRMTRAGFLTLYKIDDASKRVYERMLTERGIVHDIRKFNTRWMIRLEDSLEAYTSLRSRKSRYNLRRSLRLLTERIGSPVSFRHLSSQETDQEVFFSHVRTALSLLHVTHQEDQAQLERLSRFYPEVIDSWYREGIAEICELYSGDQVIASEINILYEGVLYVVLMVFDKEYAEYSPSILLLNEQIPHSHARGIRMIDLGGEGDEWKSVWSNQQEPTWMIKYPIHGFTRLVWGLYRRTVANCTDRFACKEGR